MSILSEYFLKSRASVAMLECLEISHPNFSQTYYVVRNLTYGGTFTHEDDSTHAYVYQPMRVKRAGNSDDLEQIISVEFGDLGLIVPTEIDAIRQGNGLGTKPTVIYRAYRSDDLTTILHGPFVLEVKTFNPTRRGTAFQAKAPSLNVSKTGELYTLPRFPMLRGLL